MTSPHLIELLPEVSAFLQRRHGLWIDGGWQSASAPADTPVRNPATGIEPGLASESRLMNVGLSNR